MQLTLVLPVFPDQRGQLVNIAGTQGIHHQHRQVAHPVERAQDMAIARAIGVHDPRDCVAGDPGPPRVRDCTSRFELGYRGVSGSQGTNGDTVSEPESQHATDRCGVVVLAPAGDPQVLDLDQPARLGQLRWGKTHTTPGGQSADGGDAGG